MSTSIEQRVAQLKFDNKQFEAGVAQSMSTLDKLKAKLNFKGASKSFEDISRAADSVSLNSLVTQTDQVGTKFDALAVIAISALNRITNEAITAGTKLVKSLSIDQVASGWSKYEARTASVQTLVNATGRSVEDIERYMDKLMLYSDETSYGFADMTSALATMVSAGGDINKLVPVLEGFGNAVSYVGKGATEYSRAIIQLSQGYGRNALMLEDWKSIEQTLGGAKQLKEVFIEVGEELGKIQKGEITIGTFNESLRNKWLDQQVMEDALGRFAEMTEKAFEMIEAGEAENVADAYAILSKSVDDYRIRAAKAAQEAKSFTEAIDATKDAVSTKWMESFQIIFGNYEEATKLWTELTNTLWDLFAASGDTRNEILRVWSAFGGRDAMIEAVKAAFDALYTPVQAVSEAIHEIFFPGSTTEKGMWLVSATEAVRDFFKALKLSEDAVLTLKTAFKALLLPVYALYQVFRVTITIIGQLIITIFALANALLSLPGRIMRLESPLKRVFGDDRYARLTAAFTTIVEKLGTAFSKVGSSIYQAGKSIKSAFSSRLQTSISKLLESLSPIGGWILDRIVDGFEKLANFDYSRISDWAISALDFLISGFSTLIGWCGDGIGIIKSFFASFLTKSPIEILQSIIAAVGRMKESIAEFLKNLGFDVIFDSFTEAGGGILSLVKNLGDAIYQFVSKLTPAKILVIGFGVSIIWLFTNLSRAIGAFTSIANGVTGVLEAFQTRIGGFVGLLKSSPILQVAIALAVLAVSLGALAQIDSKKLLITAGVLAGMLVVMGGLTAGLAAINKFLVVGADLGGNFKTLMLSVVAVAGAMALLAVALTQLSQADMEGIGKKLLSMAVMIGMMVGAIAILSHTVAMTIGDAAYVLAFAAAVNLMIAALSKLPELSLKDSVDALATMAIVVGMMVALGKASKGVKPSSGVSLLLMAGVLLLFVKAIKPIANIDLANVITALVKMSVVFGWLVLLSMVGNQIEGSATLRIVGMAASLLIMYTAIKKLGVLDAAVLAKGIASIGAILVLVGLMNVLSKVGTGFGLMKLEGSFIALSAAMLVLGVAINYIGSLDASRIAKGTTAVVTLMAFLTILAKAAGQAQKSTGSVIAMSICIGLVITAVGLLSLLDPVDLFSSAGALAVAFGGLALMFKSIEYLEIGNAISAILVMSQLFALIYLLFKGIENLQNPDTIVEKAGAIGIVMVALGGSFALIGQNKSFETANIKRIGKTLLALAGVLAMSSIAVGVLGALEIDKDGKIVEKAAALGIVMLTLGKSIDLFNIKTAQFKNVAKTLAVIVTFGAVAAAITGVLSKINKVEGLITKAGAFAIVITTMGGVIAALTTLTAKFKAFDADAVSGLASIGLVVGILGGASAAILAWISGLPADEGLLNKVLGFSAILLAMSGAIAVLSLVGTGLKTIGDSASAVIKGAAIATLIIGGLAGILYLLGYLFAEHPEWEEYLTKAEEVSIRLGSLIGNFFGGIGGGFYETAMSGIGSGIGAIGTGLSEFAENIKEFLSLDIPEGFGESILSLVTAVMAITGAEFLQRLLAMRDAKPFENFGQQLNAFAPEFVKFADTVSGIDQPSVLAAATCLEALGTVLANIPTEGGLMGAIFGDRSLEGFGSGLTAVAEGIEQYCTVLERSEISDDAIERTNKVTQILIDLANSVPKTGGLMDFLGTHDIGAFGEQLKQYVDGLRYFLYGAKQFDKAYDETALEHVYSATETLTTLANKVPKTGKLIEFLGGHNIGAFGDQLKQYAAGLKGFFDELKGVFINQNVVDASALAGDTMVKLAEKLPRYKSFVDYMAQTNLGTFGTQIATFGSGLASFFGNINETGLNQGQVDLAKSAGLAFVEIANALNPENVNSGWFDNSAFEDFSQSLTTLGIGMQNFYAYANQADWDVVSTAIDNIKRIVDIAPNMKDLDTTGVANFSQALESMASIGIGSFKDVFSDSESNIAFTIFTTMNSALNDAKEWLQGMPVTNSFIIDSILAGMDGHNDDIAARAVEAADIVYNTLQEQSARLEAAGAMLVTSLVAGYDSDHTLIQDSIADIVTEALNVLNEDFDISNGISNEFKTVAKNCIDGFAKGISDNSSTIYTRLNRLANGITNSFSDALGVRSPSTKFKEIGMYAVLGFNKGIDDNLRLATNTMVKMGESLLESLQEFYGIHSPSTLMRDEVGRYIVQGIADGITNDMSAEEAAAKKAQNIINAFQSEFDKWSLDINTADLENKLWTAMNPNATAAEANQQQIKLIDQKLTYQAERVNAANAQYQATLAALGEFAEETQKAYNTYLQEQTIMWEYANQYAELMTNQTDTNRQVNEEFFRIINEYGDLLREAGYTDEQITDYAKAQSGLDKVLASSVDTFQTQSNKASDIVNRYMANATGSVQGMVDNVEFILINSNSVITNAATQIGEGISTGISGELEKLISGEDSNFTSVLNDLGGYTGEGIIDGVRDAMAAGGDWLLDLIMPAFESFQEGFDINSPSGLMMEQGFYIVQGLAEGIEDNADIPTDAIDSLARDMIARFDSVGYQTMMGMAAGIRRGQSGVVSAAVQVAVAAYQATIRALDIHSPSKQYYTIGEMMDQGLANGIIDSQSIVEKAMSKLLANVQDTINSNQTYISPVVNSTTGSGVRVINNNKKPNINDFDQLLQWDGAGNLVPYGYAHTGDAEGSKWWVAPSSEITQAIRELSDSEAARAAYEQANEGKFTGTVEELKDAIKEAASGQSINLTQNNYSPESLSSSTIYRNTKTALASASAAASPTGQSMKALGSGVAYD